MDPEAGLYTTTFTIILTKDYFITICPQKSQIVQNFISQKPKLSPAQQSKFLIYILLKIQVCKPAKLCFAAPLLEAKSLTWLLPG